MKDTAPKLSAAGWLSVFDMLQEGSPEAMVQFDKIVNLKTSPISYHDVKITYGDLVLIIAVLRDYVKGFDILKEIGQLPINEIQYDCYYRKKFLDIADKISEDIGYDYDTKLKKCLKKALKEDNSDIGGEALSLAFKRDRQKAEADESKKAEGGAA
ncbi:MAG: hypothetical protein IKS98_08250 [Lachnospiraceae bacterium]|nr:hypothetical protein [Lachnospiraceae bacterium]